MNILNHRNIFLFPYLQAIPYTPLASPYAITTAGTVIDVHKNEMNGVLGHDSALYGYSGPETTWAIEINFGNDRSTC